MLRLYTNITVKVDWTKECWIKIAHYEKKIELEPMSTIIELSLSEDEAMCSVCHCLLNLSYPYNVTQFSYPL